MKAQDVKNVFLETELENWEDIFKLNQKFLSRFVYRGQSDNRWNLSTSLERQISRQFPNLTDKDIIPLHEREMIREFQWKYPLYSSSSPDKTNLIEWLAIMQHYGSATRLLDFTHSIFVAIYMALIENMGDSAVWAINKIPVDIQVFDKYRELKHEKSVGKDILNKFSIETANDILVNHSFDRNIIKQLYFIEPQFCNERLSRQQGLFLIPSDIKCSFLDCLSSYLYSPDPVEIKFKDLISYSVGARHSQTDITLMKINIPQRLTYKIMKYLRAMNVTTEMLFPGLAGLAKSVNYPRFSFDPEDE
jgi:hypothetical protein